MRGRLLDPNGRPTIGKHRYRSGNPMLLPNKVVAFRSGIGYSTSGGAIIGWTDQVAGRNFGDSGGTARPALTTGGGPQGTDCITFDGNDDFLEAPFGLTLTQPQHLFIVSKWSNAETASLHGGQGQSMRAWASPGDISIYCGGGARVDVFALPYVWKIREFLFSGAGTTYTENGVLQGFNGAPADASQPGSGSATGLSLGHYGVGAVDGQAAGDVAEVWIFSEALTGANLIDMRYYLTGKFGRP